jgi:hypothetical protein
MQQNPEAFRNGNSNNKKNVLHFIYCDYSKALNQQHSARFLPIEFIQCVLFNLAIYLSLITTRHNIRN